MQLLDYFITTVCMHLIALILVKTKYLSEHFLAVSERWTLAARAQMRPLWDVTHTTFKLVA